MSIWCGVCGQYYDTTVHSCGGTSQYPEPKPIVSIEIVCPHCGKKIEVKL